MGKNDTQTTFRPSLLLVTRWTVLGWLLPCRTQAGKTVERLTTSFKAGPAEALSNRQTSQKLASPDLHELHDIVCYTRCHSLEVATRTEDLSCRGNSYNCFFFIAAHF